MTGLEHLLKVTLLDLAIQLGAIVPKKATKGEILLQIREILPKLMLEQVNFGKHKGSGFNHRQIIEEDPDYIQWTLGEAPRTGGLRKLRALAMICYRGKAKEFEFQNYRDGSGSEEEQKVEKKPETKTKVKKEKKKSPRSKTPTKKADEVPIYTTSEEEDESEPEKRQKGKEPKESDPEQPATSWMDLGEKRKHQSKSSKK